MRRNSPLAPLMMVLIAALMAAVLFVVFSSERHVSLRSETVQLPVTISPIDGDDTAVLQSALDANVTVTLAAGTVWQCSSPVYIGNGDRLTTSKANPATIQRTGDCVRLIVVNGYDTRINNLQLDWNFGGVWREYASLIAFAAPDDATVKPVQQGNNRVSGVEFIASTPMGLHNGHDCWCVSLSHESPAAVEDVQILNCRSWVEGVQLVGNGNGLGYRLLKIIGNESYGGRAAAIGISSRETTRQTQFLGVTIERNILRGCHATGIFVGQDGSGEAADVWAEGIVIRGNHVEMANNGLFYQTAVLIRGGQADGCQSTALVEANTLDMRGTTGRQASWLTYVPADSGSVLTLNYNRVNGQGVDSHCQGVTVTQAGNRVVTGGKVEPLEVAN